MYKYKFVKIEISQWNNCPKEDYHEIVNTYAEKGWELVQLFAPSLGISGYSKYIEIILKKEV